MTHKRTLFAVCAFEVALILFVVAWTALADVLFGHGPRLAIGIYVALQVFDQFSPTFS